MTTKKHILQRVYDATNAGLDIIRQLLPEVDDGVINHKKPFRLRPEEHTPSARLYPPKDADDCWHVKDYGNIEGGGYFSPIDIYMWECGYGQNKFSMAVEELAEQYGVQEVLTAGTNKPDLEYRAARQEELGAVPRVKLFENLGSIDLSCWGDGVKAEHLTTYGWTAVSEVSIKYGDKVMVRKPTPLRIPTRATAFSSQARNLRTTSTDSTLCAASMRSKARRNSVCCCSSAVALMPSAH